MAWRRIRRQLLGDYAAKGDGVFQLVFLGGLAVLGVLLLTIR